MTKINCCKYCTEREVGCHAICKKYQDQRKENELLKQRIKASKAYHDQLMRTLYEPNYSRKR